MSGGGFIPLDTSAAKEAAARSDGRVDAGDTRVTMAELKAIRAGQRQRGEVCNGCTSAALTGRYGSRVYHVPGVGWFVRPAGVPLADILALLQYNWADEQADYEQQTLGNVEDDCALVDQTHIFAAMNRIAEWAGAVPDDTMRGKGAIMPQVQGYLSATLQIMREVFGEPMETGLPAESFVKWKLDGGTVLHDLRADNVKPEEQRAWHISGWSRAAVDQVVGIAAQAEMFGHVTAPHGHHGLRTVRLVPAPAVTEIPA
jgi:hypothetical protein